MVLLRRGFDAAFGSRLALMSGAFLILVIVLPVVPATWATLSHFELVSENYTDSMVDGPDYTYATAATLTISSCSRGALFVNWNCYGYIDGSRMRLANDFRRHRSGELVDVNMELRGHPDRVYHWGYRPAALAVSFALGFILVCAALILAAFRQNLTRLRLGLLAVGVISLGPIAVTAFG